MRHYKDGVPVHLGTHELKTRLLAELRLGVPGKTWPKNPALKDLARYAVETLSPDSPDVHQARARVLADKIWRHSRD